jgi:hypothetical protein
MNPLWALLDGCGHTSGPPRRNTAAHAEWMRQWEERHASRWVRGGKPGKGMRGESWVLREEARAPGSAVESAAADECVFFTIIAKRPT